ncbi:MAG: potassium-transporting ATPase subunit KdpC [Hydrogenobacter sp.]
MRELIKTTKLYILLLVITGLIYPLLITLVSQVVFREKAKGSIVYYKGQPVGSELIAQPFQSPYLFHSRPSATNYDTLSSGGSNLGSTNPELYKAVKERLESLKRQGIKEPIPSYLVFASASGLDPHLPPSAVYAQVERVSRNTGIPKEELIKLIQKHTEGRTFGFLGQERVNILMLNLELLEVIEKHGHRR